MSNALWNSSAFRLYGNDLWSTLLLKNKLTRTTRFLLLLNKRQAKKARRKAFFHWHKQKYKIRYTYKKLRVLRRQVFRAANKLHRFVKFRFRKNKLVRKKLRPLYRHYRDLKTDVHAATRIKRTPALKKKEKKIKLKTTLRNLKRWPSSRSLRFLNSLKRYQPPARRPRMLFRKYLVDYLQQNEFDQLKTPRLRRRHFLSRLVLSFRKFKNFYANLTERQFRNLVSAAKARSSKTTFTDLIQALETRVDTLLFRSGLVSSFFMARQLINHKHVYLNNEKLVPYVSFPIRSFDIISLYSCIAKKKLVHVILNRIVDVFESRLTKSSMVFRRHALKIPKELNEREARKLKRLLFQRFVVQLHSSKKQFPLELKKASLIHFQRPSHLETNYVAFATSLIADVFFKKLFYPFSIKRSAIEIFLHSRRGF